MPGGTRPSGYRVIYSRTVFVKWENCSYRPLVRRRARRIATGGATVRRTFGRFRRPGFADHQRGVRLMVVVFRSADHLAAQRVQSAPALARAVVLDAFPVDHVAPVDFFLPVQETIERHQARSVFPVGHSARVNRNNITGTARVRHCVSALLKHAHGQHNRRSPGVRGDRVRQTRPGPRSH